MYKCFDPFWRHGKKTRFHCFWHPRNPKKSTVFCSVWHQTGASGANACGGHRLPTFQDLWGSARITWDKPRRTRICDGLVWSNCGLKHCVYWFVKYKNQLLGLMADLSTMTKSGQSSARRQILADTVVRLLSLECELKECTRWMAGWPIEDKHRELTNYWKCRRAISIFPTLSQRTRKEPEFVNYCA